MNSVVHEPSVPTPKSSSPSTSCCGVVEEMTMCYEFITLVDPEDEAAAVAALSESGSPAKSISIEQANTEYLRTIKNRIQVQQQQERQIRQQLQHQQQHNKKTTNDQKTGDTSLSTSELDVCMGFWTCQDPGDLSEDDDANRPDPPPVDAPSVGSSKPGEIGSVNSPIAIDVVIVDKDGDEEGDPPGSTTATTPKKRLNMTSKSSPLGTGGRGGEPPEMKRDVWLAHSSSRRGRRSYERRDATRMEEEDDESLAALSPEEDEPLVVLEDSGSSRDHHLRQRREKARTASPHHQNHYHHRYNSPVLTNRYKPYKPSPPNRREYRHYDNIAAGASSRHRHRYHRSKDRSSRHQMSQQQEQQDLYDHQHQQHYYPPDDSDTVQACVDDGHGDSDSVRTSMTNKVMIVVVRRPQYE